MGKKITIELEDTLEERVNNAKEELLVSFKDFLSYNQDTEKFDTFIQKGGSDSIHEIADSSTPIYNKEIKDIHYLHGDDIEEAYKNAGIGSGGEDNHLSIAICLYIEQELTEYMNDELDKLFEQFIEKRSELEDEINDLKGKELELNDDLINIDSFIISNKDKTPAKIISKRKKIIQEIEDFKYKIEEQELDLKNKLNKFIDEF
jgi:hypothetical protein